VDSIHAKQLRRVQTMQISFLLLLSTLIQ